jgi:hypothetical protein
MNQVIPQHLLESPWWRLNNLYYIKTKDGRNIKFEMNSVQRELYHKMWYCNIILKGRQLGISTFAVIVLTDAVLFNPNRAAGMIAQTREDAKNLFKKIKHAYDFLPASIKDSIRATVDSAQELVFSNGSSIRVGTSLRGSTLQYLHISEFGKICADTPDKAEEIITGALNTVSPGQYIFIESTAEGTSGHFYEMCKRAQAMKESKEELTKLDYKFHFFPWWREPTYRIGSPINMTQKDHEYFLSLKSQGIELDNEQKYWYALKSAEQKDKMKREYPSTADESWETSKDGYYYSTHLQKARLERRICHVPYEDTLKVHTAWDLGYNDSTSIILFQGYGKEIRLIEYLEGNNRSLAEWINIIQNKSYGYGVHLAPHDIKVREYTTGYSRMDVARKLGFNFVCVPKVEIIPGIDAVRSLFPKLWIDKEKCKLLIERLDNYRRDWNKSMGCWGSSPLHNDASHGADSLRTLATGLHIITGKKTQEERERAYLESLKDHTGIMPGSMFYEGNQNRRSIF